MYYSYQRRVNTDKINEVLGNRKPKAQKAEDELLSLIWNADTISLLHREKPDLFGSASKNLIRHIQNEFDITIADIDDTRNVFDRIGYGSVQYDDAGIFDLNEKETAVLGQFLMVVSKTFLGSTLSYRDSKSRFGGLLSYFRGLPENKQKKILLNIHAGILKHKPEIYRKVISPHLLTAVFKDNSKMIQNENIVFPFVPSVTKEIIYRCPEVIDYLDIEVAKRVGIKPQEWIRVLNKVASANRPVFIKEDFVDWMQKGCFTQTLKGARGTKRIPTLNKNVVVTRP